MMGIIYLARKYFRNIRTYKCAGGGERGIRFARWLARSPLWSVSYLPTVYPRDILAHFLVISVAYFVVVVSSPLLEAFPPHSKLHRIVELVMSSAEAADLPKKKKNNKDYSNTTRVYDPDGYRLRADALIFKDERKQEVLMVSSRNTPNEWTIPGGGLEPNEDPRDTAAREAMEEAGVLADVWESVGVYDNDARKTRTNVFTLLVCGEAPNWKDNKEIMRQRHWISTEVAIDSLKQRDRPLKSKYLKDAYELQTRAAVDQGGSEVVMASNGHAKRVENGGTSISSDSRDSTNSETLCTACHDGGCLRNSV